MERLRTVAFSRVVTVALARSRQVAFNRAQWSLSAVFCTEIAPRTLKRALDVLVQQGVVAFTGVKRWRLYSLASESHGQSLG